MILGGNLLLWGRSTWISDAEIQVIRFSRLEANLIQVPLKCFHSKLFKLTIIWNDIPGSILQCGDDWWACDLQSICEFSFAIMIINIIIKQSWDFVSVITIIEDIIIFIILALYFIFIEWFVLTINVHGLSAAASAIDLRWILPWVVLWWVMLYLICTNM